MVSRLCSFGKLCIFSGFVNFAGLGDFVLELFVQACKFGCLLLACAGFLGELFDSRLEGCEISGLALMFSPLKLLCSFEFYIFLAFLFATCDSLLFQTVHSHQGDIFLYFSLYDKAFLLFLIIF